MASGTEPAKLRVVRFLLRWPVFVPLALLVAAGVWAGAGPWLVQRAVSFDVTIEHGDAHWALEWQRAADETWNGAWLDLVDYYHEPETLELRPVGGAADSDANAELWLYSVTPLRAGRMPVDLKAELRTAAPGNLAGHWIPFEAGPGIVYSDRQPGLLRLTVPTGGVILQMARTATSGRAVITYADDTQEVDLHSATTEPLRLALRRKDVPDQTTIRILRSLPHYPLAGLRLRWQDSGGVAVTVSNARLTQWVFGIPAGSPPLTLSGDADRLLAAEGMGKPDLHADAPAGVIVFHGMAAVGRVAGVLGVAGLWLMFMVVRSVGQLAVAAARRGSHWGRLLDGAAGAAVIAAHVGMAAWAPFLLTSDSFDYLGDAAVLVETRSFSHWGYYRTPGYSVFAAPFLVLFRDFATALGYAQGVLGILTAYFAYRIARTFLPWPWPALALLLVGLDPVLLTYERYALSECLTTFCVTLAAWLLVWQAACYRTAAPRGGAVLLAALIIGIVCGAAAYVRPNLLMLTVLLPLFLVWVCWRGGVRGRVLMQAGLTLVIALACITPWLLRNRSPAGDTALAFGAQANRLGGLWNFDAADINQTAMLSYERWQELRNEPGAARRSVYEVMPALVGCPVLWRPPTLAEAEQWEQAYGQLAREAVARHPRRTVRAMGIALASQLGLWPKFDHPSAAENEAWSSLVRGGAGLGPTNFPPMPAEHWHAARIGTLAERSGRDITYLQRSTTARWFDELFRTWRQARPFIALLFLAGLMLALGARVYPLAAIGLLALGNALALAALVFSPIDRYSAPFLPLVGVVAIYTLSRLAGPSESQSLPARE